MNTPENSENGQAPADNASPSAQASPEAVVTQQIAATLPPVESSAPPAQQPIFGIFKRKRGRPRKNPFTPPPGATANAPANSAPAPAPAAEPAPAGAVATLEPIQTAPAARPEDYEGYGVAGAAFVAGIYELRILGLRGQAEKKLPKQTVDTLLRAFSVPERCKAGMERGYAQVAMELGLPPGGGKIAVLVAEHINLELHFRAQFRELMNELRKIPDLKKP